MSSVETALIRTLLWTSVGVAAAFPTLVVPAPQDPRLTALVHMTLLGLCAMALVFHLAPLTDEPWFGGGNLGLVGRRAAGWLAVTAMVIASAATVAAATAAALRYDPSMQYLIVVGAAFAALPGALAALGTRRRFGPGAAAAAAGVIAGVVVWSLWRYLDRVGVGVDGAWVVDGARFGTLVVPFLAAAWVAAAMLFTAGTRHR